MREISIHCAFILFLYLQSEKTRYSLCLADVVLVFLMLNPLYFILYFKKMTKSNFPLYMCPFLVPQTAYFMKAAE